MQGAVYRNDVIEAFKRTVCSTHSGHSSFSLSYTFSPNGVNIRDQSGSAKCTIAEFADAVMVAALKLAIQTDTVSDKDSGWQTGEPEEDG